MSYNTSDVSYVLMRNQYGKVIVLYVGPHYKRTKTFVWVPKLLVTSVKGPKQV
jgi:hypothetical protein